MGHPRHVRYRGMSGRRRSRVEIAEMVRHHGPKDVWIDTAIFVAEQVAWAMNLAPGHIGVGSLEFGWNMLGSLGNDQQRVFNGPASSPSLRRSWRPWHLASGFEYRQFRRAYVGEPDTE
jgi:hypothetical protein